MRVLDSVGGYHAALITGGLPCRYVFAVESIGILRYPKTKGRTKAAFGSEQWCTLVLGFGGMVVHRLPPLSAV
jgi:hypothetical protein